MLTKPIIYLPIFVLLIGLFLSPIETEKIEVTEMKLSHTSSDNSELQKNLSNSLRQEKFTYIVQSGDSLNTIFNKYDLSLTLLHEILKAYPDFNLIVPDQKLIFSKIGDNRLLNLEYYPHSNEKIKIHLNENGHIEVFKDTIDTITRLKFVKGTIKNSLYVDGLASGLDDALIIRLTEIFEWDIDFNRQIHPNDSYSVIFEQYWVGNKWVNTQNVLAAQFILRGQVFNALKYNHKDSIEYFDAQGRNLRKAFTRNPVKQVRITSKYNLRRKHPVLNKIKAHTGVDYGAPVGTPIYATGDGLVTFRGWKGGFGKTIILKHGKKYQTFYAHMSKFNSKVKKGSRVKQGQVLGYVGATGLVTGPHLHYEFRVNNKHKDPLKINLPAADSIKDGDLEKFKQQTTPLLSKLKLMQGEPSKKIAAIAK